MPFDHTQPSVSYRSITVNTVVTRCRAVYIGTAQSLDFSKDGSTWVTFQGLVAGTVLPIAAVAVRVTSGAGAPAAGDVVFLD